MIKQCRQCEIEFDAATQREKYCSRACKQKSYRARMGTKRDLKNNCACCGAEYKRGFDGRLSKYCSNACRQKAYREREQN